MKAFGVTFVVCVTLSLGLSWLAWSLSAPLCTPGDVLVPCLTFVVVSNVSVEGMALWLGR